MKKNGRPVALTPQQISVIRASKETQRTLAMIFSVSIVTIWKVLKRRHPYNFEVEPLKDPNDNAMEVA